MDRQAVENYKTSLEQQKAQHEADVHAVSGAIQACDHLLKQEDAAEAEASKASVEAADAAEKEALADAKAHEILDAVMAPAVMPNPEA